MPTFIQPSPSAPALDTPEGHAAAANGDLNRITELSKTNQKSLHKIDRNGWQPIHEAARAGHTSIVRFLHEFGVDINARTHQGKGSSPLNVAVATLSEDHPVSQYLIEQGALNIEPDL